MTRPQRILRINAALSLLAALALSRPSCFEVFTTEPLSADAVERAASGALLLGFYAVACILLSLFNLERIKPGVVVACTVFFSVMPLIKLTDIRFTCTLNKAHSPRAI